MNNRYRITVSDPLLRPGLVITTEVSEKYLVAGVETLLAKVRQINTPVPEPTFDYSADAQ